MRSGGSAWGMAGLAIGPEGLEAGGVPHREVRGASGTDGAPRDLALIGDGRCALAADRPGRTEPADAQASPWIV
jgi:hypothetical protein